MRVGLAAVLLAVLYWPVPAHARRVDASLEIPVHPQIATILHLPDAVERVRVYHGGHHPGKIDSTYAGRTVHVRPRPDTPAGADALLEVQTRTVRLTFWLRVVENAGDAREDILVMTREPERPAEEVAPGRDDTARRPSRPTVSPPQPAARVPEAGLVPRRSPFDLSIHAVAALPGFTSLGVAGFEPKNALRPHLALGPRFAAAPRGGWWAIEAGVLWEWLILPTKHTRAAPNGRQTELLEVGGSWLRMEVGFRAQLEAMWKPSLYAGIGMQAHFVRSELGQDQQPIRSTLEMTYAVVPALGLGLQRQIGDVFLGIDIQMRQGIPFHYRSVDAFLSVGYVLDRGE
jgi:hypothetical protein